MIHYDQKTAYLIAIGDELLIGQTADTNSYWIADQLTSLSFDVKKIMAVHDTEDGIIDALSESVSNADLVIVTGGLGPTIDDITKRTFARFLGVEMEFNPVFFEKVKAYVEKRGAKLDELMYNYSFFPEGTRFLTNNAGTAPGMAFRFGNTIIYSVPGVPHEMKSIFTNEILPELRELVSGIVMVKKTIMTAGEMEASIADRLKDIVNELPEGVSIAYLPNPGKVKIRVSSKSSARDKAIENLNFVVERIEAELGDGVYGYDNELLEKITGDVLRESKLKLGTAESCTGGLISARITSVPGSSDYFVGGITAYSNRIKTSLLGVNEETLIKNGAVSEQTVVEMVKGALKTLKCDLAIASSGIAGPGGGTDEKPVGTIWLAVGNSENIVTKKLQLGNDRYRNNETSTIFAINMLRMFLSKKH
jgi:nicotinamide-nucleotide amidase